MNVFNKTIVLIIFYSLISCIKETPNDSFFEPQVFISGSIRNGEQTVTVKIQESVPTSQLGSNPINNAEISIYKKENDGSSTLVTNSFSANNGTYKSTETVTANIGETYWTEIRLADGTQFKSDEETLKEEIEIIDVTSDNLKNIVVFSDPGDDINFYLIRFYIYINGTLIVTDTHLSNDILYNGNTNATFQSTENLAFNLDEVIVSISNLNYNTYQYYFNQFEQYEQQILNDSEDANPGQLFLPPPANLTGNITNVTKNKKALGFFGAYSVSTLVK